MSLPVFCDSVQLSRRLASLYQFCDAFCWLFVWWEASLREQRSSRYVGGEDSYSVVFELINAQRADVTNVSCESDILMLWNTCGHADNKRCYSWRLSRLCLIAGWPRLDRPGWTSNSCHWILIRRCLAVPRVQSFIPCPIPPNMERG